MIYNPNRDVRLWSEDGSLFKLQYPGCSFDVQEASVPADLETSVRAKVTRELANVGWIGDISFVGFLGNPVRNDISQTPLHGFKCAAGTVRHFIAISPWKGDTVLEDLRVLKRLAIIDHQLELGGDSTTYYFVALRVDLMTLDNLDMLGKVARAVQGKLR